MWQIVTVAVLGLRINSAFIPLISRVGVILAALLMTLGVFSTYPTSPPTSKALLPALLLLIVASLASLPMPASVPPLWPALAETLTAAVVIGASGGLTALFVLYLVIPLFVVSATAGLVAGLSCSALGGIVIAAVASMSGRGQPDPDPSLIIAGCCVFLGVPAVGAWIRRLTEQHAPDTELAYTDAHRLLTELQVVARQLSLGLDPRTLAAALADDIRSIVPQGGAAVLGRSPGGRFVTLAGEDPPDAAETAVQDAWHRGSPMGCDSEGRRHTAVPVLMADRVVAMVLIGTATAIEAEGLRRCQALIAQSGPRLASAILFDDVRRLATTDERMRLAREIHDGIAQDLASVGYLLDDIRRDATPELGSRVGTVREQLQAMVADLRMSIFDLRSGVDDTVGLGTALSEHAQRIGGQAGLVVHVSMDESPKRLPISTEVELMRIVQEAITNVRRHARATNLWISVTVEPPRAHIQVTDDGRGLRPGRADSFGITGMRERARRIGATLAVLSGPEGVGTTVEIGLGTDPDTPREIGPLPRTVVSRATLTDPHGIPAIRPQGKKGPVPPTSARPRTQTRADQEVTQ